MIHHVIGKMMKRRWWNVGYVMIQQVIWSVVATKKFMKMIRNCGELHYLSVLGALDKSPAALSLHHWSQPTQTTIAITTVHRDAIINDEYNEKDEVDDNDNDDDDGDDEMTREVLSANQPNPSQSLTSTTATNQRF